MEATAAAGRTPLVGRREILRELVSAFDSAEQGRGSIITVRGEAGIGKSRLLEEFRSAVKGRCSVTECQCSPYQQNSPLFPFLKVLEERLDFANAASAEEKLDRLQASLARSGLNAADALPAIATLLSLPLGGHQVERPLSPVKQRQVTLELLYRWLGNVAGARPMLLVVEDLHWADPTTLEFIGMLVDRERVPGLLAVLTLRPELIPTWKMTPAVIAIDLKPLSASDVRTLVNHVASNKALPSDVLSLVVARAGGVPLFAEEITKAVIETGVLTAREDRYELTGPLPAGLIPTTVQDSLAARIDHVRSAKPVAQLAATLGQEFSYDILRAVSRQDDEHLQSDLQRLLDAGLILAQGQPPYATYVFRHALIRDAAYESVLKKTRQEYHRDIAYTLKVKFPAIAERQPDLMAHHCEGAGLVEEALEQWGRAIELDKVRAANKETIAHVGRALELVRAMPASVERSRRELRLRLSLGPALTAMKGWSSPEVRQTYTRAAEACREMGNGEELFPVLWGLWSYHFVSGNHTSASELAEQAYRSVEASGNFELLIPAMHATGYAHCFAGRYTKALAVARNGLPHYNPEREQEIFRHFQIASSAALHDQAATALWALGYPDQGREIGDRGLAVTRALGNPTAAAFGASMLAWGVSRLLRDVKRVHELADEVIRLSSEEEFSFWPPLVRIFRGWALCEEGQAEAAITEIRTAFKEYRTMGGGVLGTSAYAHLAEAQLKAGRLDEGLDTIAEGIEFVNTSGELHYEQELHRARGELLRAQAEQRGGDGGRLQEAEASLRHGLELSRSQGARSFELRAAISLARLWDKHGERRDAIGLLTDVYGSFSEGFETPDLRDAKTLLGQMGGA
jgi:predicted ATPase